MADNRTIDDLLLNKNELAGESQEQMAGRSLRARQQARRQEQPGNQNRGKGLKSAGLGMQIAGKAAPAVGTGVGAAGGAVSGAIAGAAAGGVGAIPGALAGARTGAAAGARTGRAAGEAVGKELQTGGRAMSIAGMLRSAKEKAKENLSGSQAARAIAAGWASSETVDEAKAFGMEVAKYLAKAIEEGKFSGFLLALIAALTKDILVEIIARFPEAMIFDIPLIEALQPIADSLYWIIFFIVYFVQPGILRRWIIRKHLGKIVASIIISFIPYVDMLPEATATILIIKFSADRRRRKLEKELENIEREFNLERRKKGK